MSTENGNSTPGKTVAGLTLAPPPDPYAAADKAKLDTISAAVTPDAAQAAVAAYLEDKNDQKRRAVARELAIAALKQGKVVSAPGKLVDSCIVDIDEHDDGSGDNPAEPLPLTYQVTPTGIVWLRQTDDGIVPVPLANFTTKIVTDVQEDDGVETWRVFELEVSLGAVTRRITVPAARYHGMDWVPELLGASAAVLPGRSVREHLPYAIQRLSGEIPTRTTYAHTGWREVGGELVFLHADGAIGKDGVVTGITVRLPDALKLYRLPPPPTGDELRADIHASLKVLDVAPDRLTFPIYAGNWRAVLGGVDVSLFATGRTGQGKSELAARGQQHFGAEMVRLNLPANFKSTANALEDLASAAKDVLLTVDDLVPTGSVYQVQAQHAVAERFFRGVGNHSPRVRMRADGTLKAPRPPRCLGLGTGEDRLQGESLTARTVTLEVSAGDVIWSKMTACQMDGANGLYAGAMAGFIQWLAQHPERLKGEARAKRLAELRDGLDKEGGHKRTPENIASLIFGLETFAAYAVDVGALTVAQSTALMARAEVAFNLVAAEQGRHLADVEPTRRYLELLVSAIGSGKAHLADTDGDVPENHRALGWRDKETGSGQFLTTHQEPLGERVGWTDGESVWLDPDTALSIANLVGQRAGGQILVAVKTLNKRLSERKLLKTEDPDGIHHTVQMTLEGRRRRVLHLAVDTMFDPSPAPAPVPAPIKSVHCPTEDTGSGQGIVNENKGKDEIAPISPVPEVGEGRVNGGTRTALMAAAALRALRKPRVVL